MEMNQSVDLTNNGNKDRTIADLTSSNTKSKDQFITVVSVGVEKNEYENVNFGSNDLSAKSGFVTVLTIGDEVPQTNEHVEEVLVYRLPGERLGFGLKFEGGTKTTECVQRLFIQSCAPDSPAMRVKCSWGHLAEGDEVLRIDSFAVSNMTRIDCVRCLKDSNVVIKLLVKHCTSNNMREDSFSDRTSNSSAFHSDEESFPEDTVDLRKSCLPPPPIPPRKLSRKLIKEKRIVSDFIDVDNHESSNSRQCNGENYQQTYPKSAPRTRPPVDNPPKVPLRDRKLSDSSYGPPDAEVYLDLLSQELDCNFKTESESDDTGSTVSTVIDKNNSIYLTSNPSSIASDSIPSTPTAVQKQMDLSKVVNPFEILEMEYSSNIQPHDDFLFSRFVTSQEVIEQPEKISIIPPANFQDAPLSYASEEVSIENANHLYNNNNNYAEKDEEQFEHKIVEEIKVPKPVPRKCYAKKKIDPEDLVNPQLDEDGQNSSELIDFNLPRLVNFVPKVPQKPEAQFSFTDLDITKKEDNYNKLCLMKYNHPDDFNYLYDASDIIECNNNDCEKIISCSTWSLNNHLETIGEIEEEMDSLDNNREGYKTDDEDEDDEECNNEVNNITENKYEAEENEENKNSCQIQDRNENLIDKVSTVENGISMKENEATIDSNDCSTDQEIPIIQLTQDGEDTLQKNKDEITILRSSSDVSEEMEISNFIQSEQQHAVTTSEYSSLSSLSSPPLSFSSRLPPDGQEFPPICQETRPITDNLNSDTMTTPKLPKAEPRKLSATKTPLENNSASPAWVKSYSVPDSTSLNTPRSAGSNSLWRKDRNSMGSVKDKIAIFSSGENNEQPLLPLTKVYKSSDNLLEEKPTLYDKKNQISKSCLFVNSIASTNQPEKKNIYNNNLATTNKNLDNSEPDVKPNLNYTSSFSAKPNIQLHSRSQSMLDMSNFDSSTWNSPNPDSRRLTLNSLIEQRRRGFSKLRGLVIPPADAPIAEPVLDLPEIRVKDSTNLVTKSNSISRKTSEKDEPIVSHQRNLSTSLQSPTWKSNSISNQTNLPRYSPAFKRKYLQVYVMEQSSAGAMSSCSESPKTSDSVFNSDYDISSTPLSSMSTEVFRKSSVCSDNGSYTNGDSSKIEGASAQSVDNVMSPSNSEISFEYYQSTNSTNSLDTQSDTRSSDIRQSYYPNKTCTLTRNKIKLHRLEDDSDNDSAVSSSQSSYISRECSPLPSPLDYANHNNFNNSTEENCNGHNKQKEMYSTVGSNGGTGRVLKSQSVEAINRKNILASAKCRSGRDFKNGSPLIQRKLSTSEEEKQEETNEEESPPVELEEDVKPSVVNTDEDETDMQSTSSLSDSISTASFVSKDSDKLEKPEVEVKKQEIPVTPVIKTAVPQSSTTPTTSDTKPIIKEITPSNVVLRHSGLPTPRKYLADKIERPISMLLPNTSRFNAKKRCSVNDIRKQFEQFEIEQQKPPSYPELKSPTKSVSKTSLSKLPTAKSSENVNISSSISIPNKETKATPFMSKKSAIPTKINIPKEEMEEILKEVNEGLAADNALYVNPADVISVQLQREISGGSVGITLTGGTDYEAKEITVHKVLTGSCAHKDGRLKKGDRILAINGKRMMGLTHKDSVDVLKDPIPDKVTLVVLSYKGKTTPVSNTATKIRKTSSEASIPDVNSSPPETPSSKDNPLVRVELLKDRSGLGFSLDGGKDSLKGDMPLIIKKVFTGGAAEKCGVLQAGDKLIEVNSVEVQKMTRMEVWGIMRKLPDGKVSLTVRR